MMVIRTFIVIMGVEKIRRISKFFQARIDNFTKKGLTPLAIRKRLIAEDEVSITTRAIKLYIERRRIEMETGERRAVSKRLEKRKLTAEHLAFIDTIIEENDETTAPELQKSLLEKFNMAVSCSTIKRARQTLGWTRCNARYCQLIRDINKEKRKAFCLDVFRRRDNFNDIIYTDESTIRMQANVRQSFRRRGQRHRLKGIPKHPYSVHVWAGISRRGVTQIAIFTGRLISDGYQDILHKFLLPFIHTVYPDSHRLYQDNDPKHVSKSTTEWFSKNGVTVMHAPPESPDLNPIEMMWGSMKYYLRKHVKPRTKGQLISGIGEFWQSVTPEMCNKYIDHLYKVVPAVVLADGCATGY